MIWLTIGYYCMSDVIVTYVLLVINPSMRFEIYMNIDVMKDVL